MQFTVTPVPSRRRAELAGEEDVRGLRLAVDLHAPVAALVLEVREVEPAAELVGVGGDVHDARRRGGAQALEEQQRELEVGEVVHGEGRLEAVARASRAAGSRRPRCSRARGSRASRSRRRAASPRISSWDERSARQQLDRRVAALAADAGDGRFAALAVASDRRHPRALPRQPERDLLADSRRGARHDASLVAHRPALCGHSVTSLLSGAHGRPRPLCCATTRDAMTRPILALLAVPRRLLRLPGRLPAGAPGAARATCSRRRGCASSAPATSRRAPGASRSPSASASSTRCATSASRSASRPSRWRASSSSDGRRYAHLVATARTNEFWTALFRVDDRSEAFVDLDERPRGALAHPHAPRPQGVARGDPLRLGHPLRATCGR